MRPEVSNGTATLSPRHHGTTEHTLKVSARHDSRVRVKQPWCTRLSGTPKRESWAVPSHFQTYYRKGHNFLTKRPRSRHVDHDGRAHAPCHGSNRHCVLVAAGTSIGCNVDSCADDLARRKTTGVLNSSILVVFYVCNVHFIHDTRAEYIHNAVVYMRCMWKRLPPTCIAAAWRTWSACCDQFPADGMLWATRYKQTRHVTMPLWPTR